MALNYSLTILLVLLIGFLLYAISKVGNYASKAKKEYADATKMYQEAHEQYRKAQEEYRESQECFRKASMYTARAGILAENSVKLHVGFLRQGSEFFSTAEGISCIRASLKALSELRDVYPEGDWERVVAELSKFLE